MSKRDDDVLSTGKATEEAFMRKLSDSEIPGMGIEFDPEEAERAGAIEEDAVSAEDAIDSAFD